MPSEPQIELIRPGWAAPHGIMAAMSTRHGGVSRAPFDSLNLRPTQRTVDAQDDPAAVLENQRRFAAAMGARPAWLNQVHGTRVLRLTASLLSTEATNQACTADACLSTEPGIACAVLVADCLPVLMCSSDGRAVAAAHAGWRGMASGVIEHTVQALCSAASCSADEVLAWLGPCIGPRQFEVGADVLLAFGVDPTAPGAPYFVLRRRPDGSDHWLADLPGLARRQLARAGVRRISGGAWCTFEDAGRFFSYRRDGRTGRMAAAIAIRQ